VALAEPADVSTNRHGAMKGGPMKYKWAVVSLVVIAGGVVSWAFWMPRRPAPELPPIVSKEPPATPFVKAANQKEGLSAERYLDNMTKGEHSTSGSAPEHATALVLWEKRIQSYVEEHHLNSVSPDRHHELARKTADFFQMLKTADQRQKAGLEPYTGLSGFNTMAAVMALDKEFQETMQTTFADFLYAQDEELIKGLF
jgi:hypothetical protein